MEIVNQRRKMLGSMESNAKGKNNFATKLINTEKIDDESSSLKTYGKSKKKNQTYFFCKLLPWATSYLRWKTIIFKKFWLVMYIERFIWTKNYHHLFYITLDFLFYIQNVWHDQWLLMHIIAYNSAYFWVISWTLNYTFKTGWT